MTAPYVDTSGKPLLGNTLSRRGCCGTDNGVEISARDQRAARSSAGVAFPHMLLLPGSSCESPKLPARKRLGKVRMLRKNLCPWLVLLALVATGCSRILRYPVVEAPSADRGAALSTGMNAEILGAGFSQHLIVEIDWVEGCASAPLAVEYLERRLNQYLPEGKTSELLLDDEIPLDVWSAEEPVGGKREDAAVQQFLDHLPDNAEGVEVVYVLYRPGSDSFFGYKHTWVVERAGEAVALDGITMFPEKFERTARLWVTPRRIDRNTLVHEFGHVLGLVCAHDHTQRDNPYHCANPRCIMTHPRLRSLVYWGLVGPLGARMPTDYCRECRADIREAQAIWGKSLKDDPDFVEAWREQRAAEELKAIASWYWRRGEEEKARSLLE